MRCEEVRELFTDHVEGDLPEGQRAAVLEHLEQCPACAQELRAFDHAVVAARSLPLADPPAHLRERIREAIYAAAADAPALSEARAERKRRVRVWLGAGIGAAAAAAVLVLVVVCVQPFGGGARLAQAPESMGEPAAEALAPERGRVVGGATYEAAEVSEEDLEEAGDEEAQERRVVEEGPEPEEPAPLRYAAKVIPPSGRFPSGEAPPEAPEALGEAVAALTVQPVRSAEGGGELRMLAVVEANKDIPDASVSLGIDEADQDLRNVYLYMGPLARGEKREFSYAVPLNGASIAAQAEVRRGSGQQLLARSEHVRVPASAGLAMAAAPSGPAGARGAAGPAGPRGPAGPPGPTEPERSVPGVAMREMMTADHAAGAPGQGAIAREPGRDLSFGAGAGPPEPAPGSYVRADSMAVRKRISVSFENQPLHDALREVGKKAGAKVTIGKNVANPKVTYKAHDTAVPLVFYTLSRKADAVAVQKGNAWSIVPKAPAAEANAE